MDVQVVLTQDDPKLGKRGDVIKVSRGHAGNFLIPQKKAKLALPENLKMFQDEKAKHAKEEAENLAQAREAAGKLEKISLVIEVLTGEGDKLYGAVTSQEIQKAISDKGLSIDRKHIHLEEPIRKLGDHPVAVKFHPQVGVQLNIRVVKKK